jgi:hypothetical protein
MTVRHLTAATLLSLGFATPGGRAAPTSSKYRIDLKGEQVVDLSAFGQSEQHNQFGGVAFVTVQTQDTSGGRTIDVTLDSMRVDSASQLPQSMADSAKGSTWHGLLAANGKISGLKSTSRSAASAQLDGLLTLLFPRVKPGTKVGDAWTDTTDTQTDAEGSSMTVRTVTNYSATANEARNGAKALRIDAAYSSSRSGTISNPQGQFSVDGTGTGKGTYLVGSDGRLIASESTDNSDLSVVVPQAPQPIPIKGTNNVKVTLLQ